MRYAFFLVLVALLLGTATSSYAEDCLSLSEAHEVFKLREAAQLKGASEFCMGAAAISSLQLSSGREHLENFLRSNPTGAEAYRAHELLANGYLRVGKYKEFLLEIQSGLKLRPSSDDARQAVPMASALAHYPDQSVVHIEPSSVQAIDGQIPVTINGHAATYSLDTGAMLSVISESEARRFGMNVEATSSTMGDSGGLRVGVRIANAEDVFIGKMHLKHVAFAIFPDTQEPFVEMPETHRGLIGIPVLIGMRSLSYDHSGHFQFAARENLRSSKNGNLLFDGANPVVQVSSGGKLLAFTLDTGSINTDLGPVFGKTFPDLLAQGKKEKQPSTGVGGTVVRDSTRIPSVQFNVGGKEVELKPAFVLDDVKSNSRLWAAGNLGNDLLDQSKSVSIDFQPLNLTLR